LFDLKVFRRQVPSTLPKKRVQQQTVEQFHTADKDQLPSARAKTYLLTMLPEAAGDHVFNSGGKQEWEIQRDTSTIFAIYGRYFVFFFY
jgi:hypothetical protein